MPRLSDTMERGTVARWAKKEGDAVAEGEVLAEIETDKATMELESYENGVLLKILVQEGESAELGAPIALVGEAGEDGRGPAAANGDAQAPRRRRPTAAEAAPNGRRLPPRRRRARPPPSGRRASADGSASVELRASPIARRMAADAGLDLRPLAGRGQRAPTGASSRSTSSGSPPRASRRGPRAAPPTTPRTRAAAGARSRRLGGRRGRRADGHAARGRAAHDRVEAERPALLPRVRGRHDPGDRAAPRDQPLARRGRHEGLGQRPDHPRLRGRRWSSTRSSTARGSATASSSTSTRTSASRSRSTTA